MPGRPESRSVDLLDGSPYNHSGRPTTTQAASFPCRSLPRAPVVTAVLSASQVQRAATTGWVGALGNEDGRAPVTPGARP